MSATTTTSSKASLNGVRSSKVYPELLSKVQPEVTQRLYGISMVLHMVKDLFSLPTLLFLGAFLQAILFFILKPSHASLPLMAYTIWTTGSLLYAAIAPASPSPHVNYVKTTSILPSTEGEHKSGTSGEKIAVLHLGFKNYSPLGVAAPGFKEMGEYGPGMFAELDSPEGRKKYGYLGSDSYIQAMTAVSTSASANMIIMYFRSLEGVVAFSQSELHRKAWDWYHNFTKDANHKHIGIMHEVFEADAGKWETVAVNMERMGLARSKVILDDGTEVGTLVDASKGPIATAKGRVM